jgi:hypothetical protein
MQWRDDTTLRSRGLRLRPIGKSKGYVFGHTGSGTYVSTDLELRDSCGIQSRTFLTLALE